MNSRTQFQLIYVSCFLTVVTILAVFTWEMIALLQYQNTIFDAVSPTYYTAKYLVVGYIPMGIIIFLLTTQLTLGKFLIETHNLGFLLCSIRVMPILIIISPNAISDT